MNIIKRRDGLDDIKEKDEQGASLVEYALLVALIAVVCIAALTLVGNQASNRFSSIAQAIQATGT